MSYFGHKEILIELNSNVYKWFFQVMVSIVLHWKSSVSTLEWKIIHCYAFFFFFFLSFEVPRKINGLFEYYIIKQLVSFKIQECSPRETRLTYCWKTILQEQSTELGGKRLKKCSCKHVRWF